MVLVALLGGAANTAAHPGAQGYPWTPWRPEAARAAPVVQGYATWYGPGFEGNWTYCGDIFHQWGATAASNTLPCGSVVTVTNLENGASITVTITDRGGFGGSTILDLSRGAFAAIADPSEGVIPVWVTPWPPEAARAAPVVTQVEVW